MLMHVTGRQQQYCSAAPAMKSCLKMSRKSEFDRLQVQLVRKKSTEFQPVENLLLAELGLGLRQW